MVRRRNEPEEKKPLLFRDSVLLMIATVASGTCLYMADEYTGDLSTAFRAWGYVLGAIALIILLSMATDKSRNRKKTDL